MADRLPSSESPEVMMESSSTGPHILWLPQAAPARIVSALRGLVAFGVIVFCGGLLVGFGERAWQIYFVNFLFWSGIAQAGVAMAAVYRITNARWGEPFRRIGEGMISFLPLSFLLYLVLVFGGQSIFPWVHETAHGKGLWLSAPILFGRDAIIFLILFWLSYKFVGHSVRFDLGLLKERNPGMTLPKWAQAMSADWKGWEEELQRSTRALATLTPVFLIAYAVLYSLLGFDLVMALDPEWYSTLFGWMYVLHGFFAGLAAITILAVVSRKWLQLDAAFVTGQWHDMGRFVFGFCLLSGGFFWSQFLVIWYGNLPEETSYLIKRFYTQPWETLMWFYLIFAYLFPLAVFLSKRVKQIPGALMAISLIILCALFVERFIAVVPFIWHEPSIPFGLVEVGVTAGFMASFVLCWLAFAKVVPIVPASVVPEARH